MCSLQVSNFLPRRGPITSELSNSTREFLRRHIKSIWQLELLLLFKCNTRSLSVEETSRILCTTPRAASAGIKALMGSGILVQESPSKYKYVATGSASQAVDEIERMYKERRTAVINLIYASPMQSLSDAFNLRQKEEE